MPVIINFGHSDDNTPTATLSFDGVSFFDFDYVSLVTHLFNNPADTVEVVVDDFYSSEQKTQLEEMANRISKAARITDYQQS